MTELELFYWIGALLLFVGPLILLAIFDYMEGKR